MLYMISQIDLSLMSSFHIQITRKFNWNEFFSLVRRESLSSPVGSFFLSWKLLLLASFPSFFRFLAFLDLSFLRSNLGFLHILFSFFSMEINSDLGEEPLYLDKFEEN